MRLIAPTLLVLALASNADAQVDKARVRQALPFPPLPVDFGLRYTPQGFSWLGEATPTLDELQREAKTETASPQRMLQLADLLEKQGGLAPASAAYLKAVDLFQVLRKQQPQDVRWSLGFFLATAEVQRIDRRIEKNIGLVDETYLMDKERLLRDIVQKFPNAWEGWLSLGEFYQDQAIRAWIGSAELKRVEGQAQLQAVAGLGRNAEFGEKLHKFASTCFDRAAELGRKQAEVYARRATSRMGMYLAASLDPELKSKRDPFPLLADEILGDLQSAAHLSPGQIRLQVGAAVLMFMTQSAREGPYQPGSWRLWPVARKVFLEETLARLEMIAKNPDVPARSSEASEALARLWFLLDHDPAQMLRHAQHAVLLDPTRETPWEMLTLLYNKNDRHDEAVRIALERLKHTDGPRPRYFLARALWDAGKRDEAVKHLHVALGKDARFLHAHLALALCDLHRAGDDATQVAKAKMPLQYVQGHLLKDLNETQKREVAIVQAAFLALEGQATQAEALLGQVSAQDPSLSAARRLLDSLRGGTPMLGN